MDKKDKLLAIYASIVGANYAKDEFFLRMKTKGEDYKEVKEGIMKDYLTWAKWALEVFEEEHGE